MSPSKSFPCSLWLFSAVILMELEYSRVAPHPAREYITVTYKPIVVSSFEEMMEHTKGVPGRIIVLNRKMLRGKPGQPKMIYRIVLKNEDENDNKQDNVNNLLAGNEFDDYEIERIDNENFDNETVENLEFGDDNDFDIDEQDEAKYEDVDAQDVRSR